MWPMDEFTAENGATRFVPGSHRWEPGERMAPGVSVEPLRGRVRGQVLTAGDDGYDQARAVHNGMFDKRPLALLRAEQVADVIAGVNFARDNGLDLSVRDGGHSAPGYGTNDGGLVIDLLSADVVTADGKFVTASAGENEDLFWGLRGGGGNFGVVTSLEYRLHEVDQVFAGPVFSNLADAGALFQTFDEFIQDAPEQFGGFPAFQIAPPLPFIPENRHGDTLAVAVVHWAGPLEQAQKALQPFWDVAPIVAEGTGPLP